MSGETKICGQCAEAISAEAKKCPHCQSYQSTRDYFLSSNLGGSLIFLVALAGFYYYITNFAFDSDNVAQSTAALSVSDTTIQFTEGDCNSNFSLFGTMANASENALERISVNVELIDSDGMVVDVINDEIFDLVVPASSEIKFKVLGRISANPNNVSKHKITITKARSVGRI